ncbi:YceI family protein [Arcobacter sp. LA11]|uniref:YceI family protein n=1 Tax=Arcobacter sp. LA11 TaxID=1898176 RepID=UPI0009340463|nr:YceI family protein [Arcobacter sp. LA11]
MKLLTSVIAATVLSFSLANATPHSLDAGHSEVGFSVKHLMITNVKGEFNEFDATIDFDYKTKTFNKLNAVIQTKSVDTGIVKRDNHLRSEDFFLADKHPQITFNMKSYKGDGEEGVMIGDLTIRGISKEVKLNVEEIGTIKDLQGNNRVGFTLKGKINRGDFDLKWNKALELGGFAVGEKVKLEVEVQAIEQ